MKLLKPALSLTLLLPFNLFAYSDIDLDGVEDAKDKCPNTLLTDLVDESGCKVKSLVSKHHFDIILGKKYTTMKNNKNHYLNINTLQVDYYYKNFTLAILTAKNRSMSEDTYINAKYKYKLNEIFNLENSINIVLPTYHSYFNNNKTDYGISTNLNYEKDDISMFIGYRYTFINDTDLEKINYKNTNSYSLGAGYNITTNILLSTTLNRTNSIYKNIDSLNAINLSAVYSINDNWFINLSYTNISNSISNSDISSLKIGYYY